jgi:hypothetical protein
VMTIDDKGERVQNALKIDDVIYGRTSVRGGRGAEETFIDLCELVGHDVRAITAIHFALCMRISRVVTLPTRVFNS